MASHPLLDCLLTVACRVVPDVVLLHLRLQDGPVDGVIWKMLVSFPESASPLDSPSTISTLTGGTILRSLPFPVVGVDRLPVPFLSIVGDAGPGNPSFSRDVSRLLGLGVAAGDCPGRPAS